MRTATPFVPATSFPEDFEENPEIEKLKGPNGEDPYEVVIDIYKSMNEEPPTRLQHVLEDYGWVLMIRRDEEEFRKHWPRFQKLHPLNWLFGITGPWLELPDAAWRTCLSMLLKRTPDKGLRRKLIHDFLAEYHSAIHK